VARRALAFGMRVLGYDPFLSLEQADKLGIEKMQTVEEMLPQIDYLTAHTPLTPETRHIIGTKEIELIKPGARIVNAARGGIYDETALAEGLKSGKLAGVALDVYEQEPCTDSELFTLPGVLCTPHLGASTEEAQTQVAVEAVQSLVRCLTTGEIRHAVNMAAVDPKTLKSMLGSIDVAYRLGRLLAQWRSGPLSSCHLHYRGEAADRDTKLLTASFCAGLLENTLDEEVNIVNSEMLMRERGMQLIENREPNLGDFSSSISAHLTGENASCGAAGTLFGRKMARLIRLEDYRLEAYLDGILCVFTHLDVPGIIGKVGSVFGTHDVNIAQMSVGRAGKTPGGTAIGVLNLDSLPSQTAINDVLEIDAIQSVRLIELPAAGELPTWLQGIV
jgi:D-3-phosphoglycerate dehydrogenase